MCRKFFVMKRFLAGLFFLTVSVCLSSCAKIFNEFLWDEPENDFSLELSDSETKGNCSVKLYCNMSYNQNKSSVNGTDSCIYKTYEVKLMVEKYSYDTKSFELSDDIQLYGPSNSPFSSKDFTFTGSKDDSFKFDGSYEIKASSAGIVRVSAFVYGTSKTGKRKLLHSDSKEFVLRE